MFRLLRYFSIASLISMILAAAVLGYLHQHFERGRMVEFGESNNVALARAFSNIIWPPFSSFAEKAAKLDREDLRSYSDIATLDQGVRASMRNTTTVKVKVIYLDGRVIYSTDPTEIGTDSSTQAGFITALRGGVASEFTHYNKFYALSGEIYERDMLTSYVALRRNENLPVEGVLEIYSDVTEVVANDLRQQQLVVQSVVIVLVLLYAILFVIVRHADKVIRRQYEKRLNIEQHLQYATTHDSLTELPNRVLLMDRIRQSLTSAERHKTLLAVAHVDLDNFKNINNSMGHQVGDEVLKVVARRLSGCLREGDTIARIGGDEFVVSLPDVRSSVNLFQIAKKMLNAISLPVEINGRKIRITASIGIALYPEHGRDADTLMRHADLAMYSAKHLGRNRHQIFVEHMSEQVQMQVRLEEEMWRALGSNEFLLYYQPVIDLNTGEIVGAEALLRWPNSRGTWMSPSEFIPLCERCGLIAPLSEWVLTEACSQLRSWHESGHGMSNFTMAVNLSPRHFATAGLPKVIGEVIEQAEIDPRWLHLDISESLLSGMSESIRTNFEGIKRLGIKFSLDDFGTGFSSLGYLRNYPIDLLKIDRSLISDLPDDADHAAIVTTIISLANSLGLTVVAKGVENDEQVAFLRKHGCHQAQGFLFSRPLPPEEFLSLVMEGRDMLRTQSLIPFKSAQ